MLYMLNECNGKLFTVDDSMISKISPWLTENPQLAHAAIIRFADGDWGDQRLSVANEIVLARKKAGDLLFGIYRSPGLTILVHGKIRSGEPLRIEKVEVTTQKELDATPRNLATGQAA